VIAQCDFVELAAPGVRSLHPYQPGKPESELRREYGLENIVKLASNENPLGPSPQALAAIEACLPELARYPDGNGFELKQALAAHHGVDPQCITLGNGSNDILEFLARAFVTANDEVIYSAHAFAVYPLVTQAIGAKACVAQAYPGGHAMPHGHDLAAFQALLSERTRLIFIANPNNPTGTWISSQALQTFLDNIPDQALVVVDEAYFEYVDAPDYASAIPWLERYANLIVTRTFSKAYGLAGVRVGYAVSHQQVADLMNRVRQPFNVNSPALAAARAALDDEDYINRSRTVNRDGMTQLQQAMNGLGLGYLPSVANFLCIDVGRPGQEVFQNLLPKGVIVRPVANYGLADFIRVTIGTEQENRRFIEALTEIL
jgi:histidinol-phosphate aminotransferase